MKTSQRNYVIAIIIVVAIILIAVWISASSPSNTESPVATSTTTNTQSNTISTSGPVKTTPTKPAPTTPVVAPKVTPKTPVATTTQPAPVAPVAVKPTGRSLVFNVTVDDSSTSLTNISVTKGDNVTVIFSVRSQNVYSGGLDFRSPVVNTGTINSGSSGTVTFMATSSFAFTPYSPGTNLAKPYTIGVTVGQ